MEKKVLIVDDDQEMLRILRRNLDQYSKTFSVLTSEQGPNALELLKKNHVSLVILDLEMSKMDNFGLLTHLMEQYPDIPAIVLTGSPEAKEQFASKKSVAGCLEKPFIVEDLANNIVALLKKEAEGGVLRGVAPGTFLQLMEMEQKTCTIRLTDERSGMQGVLFFREGEVIDARIDEKRGREAAYVMLAWDEATLMIQDLCPVEGNNVQADLQALLLEAMRLKDEDVPETKEKMTQEEIDEYIVSVNQIEVAEDTASDQGALEITLEEGQEEKTEGYKPEVRAEEKRPAPPAPVIEQKGGHEKIPVAFPGHPMPQPSAKPAEIPYTTTDNILVSLSNWREAIFGSAIFTFIFRLFLFFAVLGLIAFSFLYSTMESNQDLLNRIDHAKAEIKSKEAALTQLDGEIQDLYNTKEEYYRTKESQTKIMELDLRISELGEKQDNIISEIEIHKKAEVEARSMLESHKKKGFFRRIIERAKSYL